MCQKAELVSCTLVWIYTPLILFLYTIIHCLLFNLRRRPIFFIVGDFQGKYEWEWVRIYVALLISMADWRSEMIIHWHSKDQKWWLSLVLLFRQSLSVVYYVWAIISFRICEINTVDSISRRKARKRNWLTHSPADIQLQAASRCLISLNFI